MKKQIAAVMLLAILCGAGVVRAVEQRPPVVIAVLGDSLSAGYGLKPEEAFPARLEAALAQKGYSVKMINAGVSGDTTAGGKARLEWVLQDNPAIVLVELGANDALRGLKPEEARANLDAILTALKARNIAVLLAGMKAPLNLGVEYSNAFNAIYPDLARKHDVALYPFFLDGVAAKRGLNQADGLHPTAEGVEAIARNIAPHVEALIKGLPADK